MKLVLCKRLIVAMSAAALLLGACGNRDQAASTDGIETGDDFTALGDTTSTTQGLPAASVISPTQPSNPEPTTPLAPAATTAIPDLTTTSTVVVGQAKQAVGPTPSTTTAKVPQASSSLAPAASTALKTPAAPVTPEIPEAFATPDRLALDFESANAPTGDLTKSLLEQVTGKQLRYAANSEHLTFATSQSNTYLRQEFIPTAEGTDVTEFITAPGQIKPSDDMWLSYRVFFEPGWEWVQGGKLPGLGGGTFPTNNGGADGSDGFSARMNWRKGGALSVYAFHPDRSSAFGDYLETCTQAPVGKWVQITQHVVMNTGSNFDGGVQVWVDGQLVLDKMDMRWRTTGTFGVDVFAFTAFYGGNSPTWAPSKTTHARFDAFKMSSSELGVDGVGSGKLSCA